jgi:hypothetical protein
MRERRAGGQGSPKLADIDEETVGALFAEAVVDVEIGPGGFVELDPESYAPAGLKGLQAMGVETGE